MMNYSLEQISRQLGAILEGEGEKLISGIASLDSATDEQITFAEDERFLARIEQGAAGAVIVGEGFPAIAGKNLLRVPQPRLSFVYAVEMFLPEPVPGGIDTGAKVHESVTLAGDITIGACAVVCAGASIGAGSVVQSGAYIGPDVVIGERCRIEANATLLDGVVIGDRVIIHSGAVIGGEGFGFVWVKDHHHKVPQVGRVAIENDVEVGCNSCVDRAALGVTYIRRGTKIDNHVHVGHNSDIGEDVIITGQVGISGSVTVGDRAMFGGQSGVVDHVTIGEGALIGASTLVTHDVAAGESVWGFTGKTMSKAKHELAAMGRLPELLRRFRQQERKLVALKSRIDELEGGTKTP
ncbi:MAG: UDP-3-O-(3-hydroxymyristoyl)glucosamine N-acyltransferase [Candidatus Sedimenticola sp. (ex Thyasira tokunagai)]